MSLEENKAVIRRVYQELWNAGDLAVVDELFAPSYVRHATFHPLHGTEGVKEVVTLIRTAFPDHRVTVEDVIAEGDKVVARWSTQGTHSGPFRSIGPTGKRVQLTGVTVSRLAGGRIAEEWVNWDSESLMEQLGVLRAPGQAGS